MKKLIGLSRVVDNSQNALDIYAKVEDLLGVYDVTPKLYAHYLLFLQSHSFHSLLDVGCGSGIFMDQMNRALGIDTIEGIDLSSVMVEKTKMLGFNAQCIALEELDKKFDVITAVFDMLNYLDKDAIKSFFKAIGDTLNDDGVFLCDINTLYAFENIAVGTYVVDDEDRFLSIDSDFDNNIYSSDFTLFEKENSLYKKSQDTIKQFYYSIEDIVNLSGLTLIESSNVNLYDFEEYDKEFLVFKK